MSLTAAQIVTLATQIAKCPGMTSQAGQFLNATLQDLCQDYDIEQARGTFLFTFNNGAFNANVPGSGTGSGPYAMPSDYLRMQVSDGKDEFFYTINGVPYPLIQTSLAEYDWMVQTPGFNSYPYNYATDKSQSPVQLFVWPPASGSYACTMRYWRLMADIVTPESSNAIPWFPNTDILITSTAGRLMGITGDSRYADYMSEDVERVPTSWKAKLSAYFKNAKDREGAVQTVGKDRRRWGRPFDQLKNTKNIGWCIAAALLWMVSAFPAPEANACTAPCTKAQITTDINANWPDNTTQLITPALLRNTVLELVNSYVDTNGAASFTCPTHQFLTAIATLSSYTCAQPSLTDLNFTAAPCLNVSGTTLQSCVLPSRAVAATLNLSGFSAIETLGYAQPGDGGGAYFVKQTAWFQDSFIMSLAITTSGSGCTNGTYYGVAPIFVSGTNLGHGALLNIVVSGGGVQSVTATTPGNQYAAGDVLSQTTSAPGFTCSGSSPTFTVTPTTPTGSFTDTASNRWQIVPDKGNNVNDRQFGAVKNYTQAGGDGAATNDKAAIQNMLYYAFFGVGSGDAGGFSGATPTLAQGASLVCGGLITPSHVPLTGLAEVGSTLKECDAEANTQHFITLGDPLAHQTCFFNGVRNLTLFAGTGTISGNIAMVYSNCIQDDQAISNVSIYPIRRACGLGDTGYGGPSIFHVRAMYCIPNSALTPFGVNFSGASNIVIDGGTWFSSGGTPWAGQAIIINTNGVSSFRIQDVHVENIATGAYVNTPAGGGGTMTHIIGMTGNATVTNLINRVNGSVTGQLKVEDTAPNGSGCTVFNGAACATTSNVFAVTTY